MTESTKGHCKEIILDLNSLDLPNSNDKVIRSILDKLHAKPIPAPICDYAPGTVIMRGRCIKATDEIHSKHELSYVPAEKNTKYQRASTPNQTMFYGILSDAKDTQLVGCLGEVCDCFRDPNPQDGNYYVIISFWLVCETLSLFTIINPKTADNKSDNLKKMSSDLKNFIENNRDYFEEDEILLLQEFMYQQFNKKVNFEHDYWIPALFTTDLIQSGEIDGILYESAQVADEKLDNVLCLAIKPQSVDSKLEFLYATKITININNKKATLQFNSIEIE